jgi:hypothetical protein
VGAGPAGARDLKIGFLDPVHQSPNGAERAQWLDRTQRAGADLVRLSVHWARVAGPAPPANPSSPVDPSYSFADLDAAVRDVMARGLEPILTIAVAPSWAEGAGRRPTAPPGSWKPDPEAFGAFAAAVAARYTGAFDPPGAAPVLPRVRYFQALNEPNLPTYLSPQWKRRRPASPAHYRKLLNRFYPSVKSAHPGNVVLTAGTAPYGSPPGGPRMRPLRFWQSLLCLKRKRGRLHDRRCRDPVRADVIAHHPITGRPRSRARQAGDVQIPELRDLRRVLRKAERAHNVLPAGNRPLWVTELWWETDPPDRFANVTLRQQARWIAEGLYLLWKQRIPVAVLFLIKDQPYDRRDPFATYQSGVYFANGRPKPSRRAIGFPFVAERRSPRKLTVWGIAPRAGPVVVQRKHRGHWRGVRGFRNRGGPVFTATIHQRGPGKLRARVGGRHSPAWRQDR